MTDWLKTGNGAVITGGASGIGRAAAERFLAAGMNVVIADLNEAALSEAAEYLSGHPGALYTRVCDVADYEQVLSLQTFAADHLGHVHCLMNNAGASVRATSPWQDITAWKKQIDINLWGIVHGCHAFIPQMLAAGERAAVINTGSKQGITNPPSNYGYNLSKAGVKNYTESLAHALRQEDECQISAHLMVPGFTYTGMIARFTPEKPPGAWTSEEAVEFMLNSLGRGDFYILCPDHDTPRALDEKRIQWNTDDLINNRSALSRWDPAFKDEYESFLG